MSQRTALLLSVGLLAFMLTIVGTTLSQRPTAQVDSAVAGSATPVATASIAPEFASALATGVAPNVQLTGSPRLVNLQGRLAFEVPTTVGAVFVNATTGVILAIDTGAPSVPTTSRGQRQAEGRHSISENGQENSND